MFFLLELVVGMAEDMLELCDRNLVQSSDCYYCKHDVKFHMCTDSAPLKEDDMSSAVPDELIAKGPMCPDIVNKQGHITDLCADLMVQVCLPSKRQNSFTVGTGMMQSMSGQLCKTSLIESKCKRHLECFLSEVICLSQVHKTGNKNYTPGQVCSSLPLGQGSAEGGSIHPSQVAPHRVFSQALTDCSGPSDMFWKSILIEETKMSLELS